MNDGGGIHTIGRSRNTSIHGNYFHQLAAGSPGEISEFAQARANCLLHSCERPNLSRHVPQPCVNRSCCCLQSIIYIDNWSCDLNITDNVVDDCPGTKQGFYFFQVRQHANCCILVTHCAALGNNFCVCTWFLQGHTGNNGLAHDNEIQRLAVRNGGHLSGISVACNCSEVDVLAAVRVQKQMSCEVSRNVCPVHFFDNYLLDETSFCCGLGVTTPRLGNRRREQRRTKIKLNDT